MKLKKKAIFIILMAGIFIISGCAKHIGTKTNNSPDVKQNNTQQNDAQKINTNEDTAANSSNDDSENSKDILSKISGEWYEEDYIEQLKKTKSPNEAQKKAANGTVILEISKENDSYKIMRGYGFHQAEAEKVLNITKSEKDTYQLKLMNQSNQNVTATIVVYKNGNNISRIVFSDSKNKNVGMVMQTNLASLVLDGKYANEKGKIYTFKNNNQGSTAVWPDKTFKYCVNFDTIIDNCDSLYDIESGDLGERKDYVYEWHGSTLDIYKAHRTNENSVLAKDKSSVVRLHAVK